MTARERARLALNVLGDALDRVLYPRQVGTPQEHVDRINELLGRGRRRGEADGGQGRHPVPVRGRPYGWSTTIE
jgi:hypothetical protein